jgi:hypothetical protein
MTKTANPQTAKCDECKRPLTSAVSIARGRGRTCERNRRRRNAALVLSRPFKNAEAARTKALDLIAEGALVRTRHEGQYLAVGSDGVSTYLVDTVERSCICRGHQRQGRCYHLLAADTVELAAVRRTSLALAA